MPRKRVHKVTVIKNSPFRPVTWRYDRILELLNADTGRAKWPVKAVDDEYTARGYWFIRKWEQICQATAQERQADLLAELFPENPGLYYAYEIFLRPEGDHIKSTLEARILARQSDEKVAKVLCICPADTINWYEKLFFNVRDRLDSADYISKQVIGPLVGQGLHNVDIQLSAKFFAYFGGEVMLDYMLYGVDKGLAVPRPGQSIDSYADSFFQSMVRGRSIVAAQSFEVDVYKVMPLLELHARLIEEHNKAQLAGGPRNQLEETISALLGAIPWAVGTGGRQQLLDSSPVGNYISGSAVELRADDMLKIAVGQPVGGLEDIKTVRLPPPRKKSDTNENAEQGSRE